MIEPYSFPHSWNLMLSAIYLPNSRKYNKHTLQETLGKWQLVEISYHWQWSRTRGKMPGPSAGEGVTYENKDEKCARHEQKFREQSYGRLKSHEVDVYS